MPEIYSHFWICRIKYELTSAGAIGDPCCHLPHRNTDLTMEYKPNTFMKFSESN